MRCQFKIKCVFALVISNIDTMKTNLTCFWMTFIFAAMKCVADELKSKVLSLSVTCFYTSDLSLHCLKETKFSSAWKKEKKVLFHIETTGNKIQGFIYLFKYIG